MCELKRLCRSLETHIQSACMWSLETCLSLGLERHSQSGTWNQRSWSHLGHKGNFGKSRSRLGLKIRSLSLISVSDLNLPGSFVMCYLVA